MKFKVLKTAEGISLLEDGFYLIESNWDDYSFKTTYMLKLVSGNQPMDIGTVKIGEIDQRQPKPSIAQEFSELSDNFFSLGQEPSYYERIEKLDTKQKDYVINALRDMVYNSAILHNALKQDVTKDSLMRVVPLATIKGQFQRIISQDAKILGYSFKYKLPEWWHSINSRVLEFKVEPEKNPPANIQVLIGRNGVGKTSLIGSMYDSLVTSPYYNPKPPGQFIFDSDSDAFANVIFVSFNVFDRFRPLENRKGDSSEMTCYYVGIKRDVDKTIDDLEMALKVDFDHLQVKALRKLVPTKSIEDLDEEFSDSLSVCLQTQTKTKKWEEAIELLNVLPRFKELDLKSLLAIGKADEFPNLAKGLFKDLSAGNKIVLLILTRLVELVDERTFVLIDEPETHLHPPLLALFIRILSKTLKEANGMALIATHSPVVLQEVPKQCVKVLVRSGELTKFEEPELETFGENVGTLTHETFRLEVTECGYSQLIQRAVTEFDDYEAILQSFNKELGSEAKALIRGLLLTKKKSEEK